MYWWDQTLKMEARAVASRNREAVLRQAAQGLVEDLSEIKERAMALESKVKYLIFSRGHSPPHHNIPPHTLRRIIFVEVGGS